MLKDIVHYHIMPKCDIYSIFALDKIYNIYGLNDEKLKRLTEIKKNFICRKIVKNTTCKKMNNISKQDDQTFYMYHRSFDARKILAGICDSNGYYYSYST